MNLGVLQTKKKEIQNMPEGQMESDSTAVDQDRATYAVAGNSSLT